MAFADRLDSAAQAHWQPHAAGSLQKFSSWKMPWLVSPLVFNDLELPDELPIHRRRLWYAVCMGTSEDSVLTRVLRTMASPTAVTDWSRFVASDVSENIHDR